jgi:ketosteroid isomerase-like protein
MSDATLVETALEAINRRDVDALVATLDEGVELRSLLTEAERPVYHGHQEVREWLSAVLEVFPDWRPAVQVLEEEDGGVLVNFVVDAHGSGSGAPIHQTYWVGVRVARGKITFVRFCRTRQEALEALS